MRSIRFGIWDIAEERFWDDEDGEFLSFKSPTDARNLLFTEQYRESFVELFIEIRVLNTTGKP